MVKVIFELLKKRKKKKKRIKYEGNIKPYTSPPDFSLSVFPREPQSSLTEEDKRALQLLKRKNNL